MGHVAKTWPPCHGGGWKKDFYTERGAVELESGEGLKKKIQRGDLAEEEK